MTFPLPPPSTDEVHQHGLPLLRQAATHAEDRDRILLSGWPNEDGSRDIVSYAQVLARASQVTDFLLKKGTATEVEKRLVAHLTVPGWEYVAALWGAWAGGFGSVPLALTQKAPELQHVLMDAEPQAILIAGGVDGFSDGTHKTHIPSNESELLRAAELAGMSDRIVRLVDVFASDRIRAPSAFHLGSGGNVPDMDSPALVLYTSGTTGRPKGVVSSHRNVYHQVTDLVTAWQWKSSDVALHVLPLHHVHGIINILSCAAYVGARVEFRKFDAKDMWQQWARPAGVELPTLTLFMAVPTIYAKLLEASEHMESSVVQDAVKATLGPMRLMVSGSAALPVAILERWKAITGHTLLERYGMTEFAMALSNPYEPATSRQSGHVGLPLPSVEVRIVNETGEAVESGTSGLLQVRGLGVFQEYLNRPEATKEAFTNDGYFCTGDVAEFNVALQSFRILGRASVDIIKMGGYKLSALEIERDILEHPDVAELAVLGVPDDIWGERVGMICRMKPGRPSMTLEAIRDWSQDRMSRYKVPSRLVLVDEIPKNAMGKVNKKSLLDLFDTVK